LIVDVDDVPPELIALRIVETMRLNGRAGQ
jgi:hypothetical protein